MAGTFMQIDDRAFKRALLRFYVSQKKSWPQVLRAQGRLISVNLAYQTQPFGNELGRAQGEGKTKADILRVYAAPGQVYQEIEKQSAANAKAFWSIMQSRKFQSAKTFLSRLGLEKFAQAEVGLMDDGQSHQAAKAAIPTRPRIKKSQKITRIVTNPNRLNVFLKKIATRVGMAKSGWAACAKILGGTRGIPQWVTRHANKMGKGYVMDFTSQKNPYLIMINQIPWVDKCLNQGQMQRALDIQTQKMMTAIDIAMSKDAKAMGF
ncbi:hypothetical protein EBZ39_04250 [bacterium]|nr:hypothetical protein [bacterium]